MKKASAEARNKNFILAIELTKKALSKIEQSNLLYCHASYTKVIPSIRDAFKKGMSHRCTQIQEVRSDQCIARIYDKLRLTAKREKIMRMKFVLSKNMISTKISGKNYNLGLKS